MPFTQDGRIIKIDTPLGKDVLLLQGFTGQEGISQVFRFDLELLSEVNSAIAAEDILGRRVTITIALPGFKERYLNGFISAFEQSGRDRRFTYYRAQMAPWLWFLGRTASCRMFQDKTVLEIITKVFQDLGFTDYRNATEETYETREYCVQYRETALNFVSRLMEQYGIFYFFEHDKDKHTLVLADSTSVYQECPDQAQVRFTQITGPLEDEDSISDFSVRYELRPGKYALTDYNFETPTTDLGASLPSTVTVGGNERLEIYDYPGEYLDRSAGETLARIRMEEEEAAYTVARGVSNCRAFVSGYKFTLTDHYRDDFNQAWTLLGIQHAASVGGSYYGADRAAEPENYTNTFSAIPASAPFRPPRVTPRPVVQGPQTAVVAGKAGEEIWVDKYGRVKVQFHWDRESQADETSSCWIRVSQLWAGKNWGAMWIPRIGQEVIVDFLEGDPDQPIITGRVYNAVEMPPYELPAERTKSTIKSYSSKGGGGFNEIRFEDKKGSEQIFIHAQNRQDNRVRGNSYETVGGQRHLVVYKDQYEHVKGDKYLHIEGDHFEVIDSSKWHWTKGDRGEKADGTFVILAGQKMSLAAPQLVHIGSDTTVTLKGPGGFIQIDAAGVTIQGTNVLINSGGSPARAPSCNISQGPDAQEADTGKPGQADQPPPRRRQRAAVQSQAAQAMKQAAQNGTAFSEICAEEP